jgi:WD40 repeat protein
MPARTRRTFVPFAVVCAAAWAQEPAAPKPPSPPPAIAGLVRLVGHEREVTGVAFVAGDRVVSAGRDGTVRVWSPGDARQVAAWQPQKPRKGGWLDLAASGDGTRVAGVGGRGVVTVWNVADGAVLAEWTLGDAGVGCLGMRPDGGAVAVGMQSGVVLRFDATGGQRTELAGHQKNVLTLQWNHAGSAFASGDSDGIVMVWNAAATAATRTFQPQDWFVGGLAWSHDDRQLATCSKNRKLRVHTAAADAKDPAAPPVLECDGDTKLYAVAWCRGGALLATGGRQDQVKVFRVADGALVATLQDPQPDELRGLVRMAVSPDGGRLAVAHMDGVVRVWDLPKADRR